MDRLEALNKLPELSAGCLDAATEAAVRRWVEECPHCQAEWQSLERFVEALDVPQAPLSESCSRQMWARCSEAIFDKAEAQRVLSSPSPSAGPSSRAPLWSWAKSQPRWGWAMLGSAVAILGATLLAPDTAATAGGAPTTLASTTADSGNPGELQVLGRPPSYAASMVDHHAQMAADPFGDRVGSSLVSLSASGEESR